MNKNSRRVSAVGFSQDGKLIACADMSNDHMVSIWDWGSEKKIWEDKGGPDQIFDLSWGSDENGPVVCSGGRKHIKFWWPNNKKVKKGIFGKNPQTSFACTAWNQSGTAFTGGCNGKIYKW